MKFSCLCLTSPKTLASQHRNTMPQTDGPGLRPAAASVQRRRRFLNRQEPSSKLQPSTSKRCLRHTGTRLSSKLQPSSLQNVQAFGLQLPLPNLAFWTDKKLAPNCSFQASKTLALHTENPCWLPLCLRHFLTPQETSSKLQPLSRQNVGSQN